MFGFAGTLSVEAIYQDRDQFAQLVREVASPDVGRMGIEILSFTIKDVYDSVEYLESLGRAQTANVKRDADIGVAEANRDAGIRVSHVGFMWQDCRSFWQRKVSVSWYIPDLTQEGRNWTRNLYHLKLVLIPLGAYDDRQFTSTIISCSYHILLRLRTQVSCCVSLQEFILIWNNFEIPFDWN